MVAMSSAVSSCQALSGTVGHCRTLSVTESTGQYNYRSSIIPQCNVQLSRKCNGMSDTRSVTRVFLLGQSVPRIGACPGMVSKTGSQYASQPTHARPSACLPRIPIQPALLYLSRFCSLLWRGWTHGCSKWMLTSKTSEATYLKLPK